MDMKVSIALRAAERGDIHAYGVGRFGNGEGHLSYHHLQVQPFFNRQIAFKAFYMPFGANKGITFLRRKLIEKGDDLLVFIHDIGISYEWLAFDNSTDETI